MRIVQACALALLAAAFASPAGAAVSVIGNGVAHDCYIKAEYHVYAKDGIELCTQALKKDVLSSVDRASTLINRGILKAHAADPDGALADYDAAIALGENLGEAYVNRSATLIFLKRYGEALHDADQAVQRGTKRMEVAYFNRGLANESLGNIQAAYADYSAALKAQPRFAAATEQLARFRVVKSDN
jgi:tetratricopeptide (TPR) repeat protein